MQDPQIIWRLGRWIARRENGAAHLVWEHGEFILTLDQGRIVSAGGFDSTEVARRLECQPAGNTDLLEEARSIAASGEIPEPQAIGAAKEVIQDGIKQWMKDPGRGLNIVDGDPDDVDGSKISITHTIVELVLASTGDDLASAILPNHDVLLRRTSSFLDLYGPLRLSEEADLIVAKVSGQRTADEIATRSPHGQGETIRLLCALVATGMLEAVSVVNPTADLHVIPSEIEYDEESSQTRRLSIPLIAGGLVVLAIALGLLGLWLKAQYKDPSQTLSTVKWALVVDMGCEPDELRRILTKARSNPKTAQPVAIGQENGEDPCWQLAWGTFSSREDAEKNISKVPSSLKREGFQPLAIELPEKPTPMSELNIDGE